MEFETFINIYPEKNILDSDNEEFSCDFLESSKSIDEVKFIPEEYSSGES